MSWAWGELVKLHSWLKTVLGPVVNFLKAVRADILSIYTKWLRPIFTTIDAVRATLQLLADFHLKFAQQLDAALTALEQKLLAPIQFALQQINQLINWTTLVIDEFGLFQRATLLHSLYRDAANAWAIVLGGAMAGSTLGGRGAGGSSAIVGVTADNLASALQDYYTDDSGDLAPAIDATAALWQSSVTP